MNDYFFFWCCLPPEVFIFENRAVMPEVSNFPSRMVVPVDVVYFDFKSAFETMQHDHLISVMHSKGIGGKVLQWISDFVRNRSFRVKIGNTLSEPEEVVTGCPQGTVLASLLFILYIDGLGNILPDAVPHVIYADDVKMYIPILSEKDGNLLQIAIDDFTSWSCRMSLSLTVGKC